MSTSLVPPEILDRFTVEEREHAIAILAQDYPVEWNDIVECLRSFTLKRSEILQPGGRKTRIADSIDDFLHSRGWEEKGFDTQIVVDDISTPTPTHKIDNFKNGVGVEVEWNNKDPFFDRDLNNFRLLRQLGVLSVGIIITRESELQEVFNQLGKGKSYGASTTHWSKLIPKVDGGGAGGCPLLLIGLGPRCYDPNE